MESDLLSSIITLQWVEFTIPMLQKATALSNAVLHRLIHGYTSRGAAYTGLLEKCPAIAYTDRTIISEDETDRALYAAKDERIHVRPRPVPEVDGRRRCLA